MDPGIRVANDVNFQSVELNAHVDVFADDHRGIVEFLQNVGLREEGVKLEKIDRVGPGGISFGSARRCGL